MGVANLLEEVKKNFYPLKGSQTAHAPLLAKARLTPTRNAA